MKKFNLIFLVTILISTSCSSEIRPYTKENDHFNTDSFSHKIPFATPEIIRLHESNLKKEYKIGPGDRVAIQVWNRDKLSGEHTVGPFGVITLPMIGDYKIGGLSRKKSSYEIYDRYKHYYNEPIITVNILKYLNNKVFVLGRVSNPGVIHFNGGGTLLEALSMAGGLPTRDKTIFLSKCYIVRGNNQIIWINLLQLLQNANIKLNIKLANNDIIYIPASMDASVFVMGDVKNPGSYQIQTSGLSVLDAVNLAGGVTENAKVSEVRLIREMKEKDGVRIIDLNKMIAQGDFSRNYRLKDNDIIFVPKKGIAKFNYYLRQIDPFLRTFITSLIIDEAINK